MAIPSLRINAPYVYLTKDGNGPTPYALYILVAVYEGTTLSGPVQTLPFINFTVSGTATSLNVQVIPFRVDLPVPANPANPLDKPEINIEVRKNRNGATAYVPPAGDPDPDIYGDRGTTVLYEDSDTESAIPGNKAFNCPYVYLTNPYAIEGRDGTDRTPDYAGRCYVPLQGTDYDPAVQPLLQNTPHPGTLSPENGEQEVIIFTAQNSTKTEVNPDHIDGNKKEYKDDQRQVGFYKVTVTIQADAGNPPRKRTSSLPHKSSDTHPNGFID